MVSTSRHLELRQLCKAVTRILDQAAYPNVVALLANAMAGTGESLHRTDLLEAAIEANSKAGNLEAVSAHLARLAYNLVYLDRRKEALEAALRAEEVLQQGSPSSRALQYVRSVTACVFAWTGDISRARCTIAELDEITTQQHALDDTHYLLMRNAAVAEIDFVAGDYASVAALCRETMHRLASALPLAPAWRDIRILLVESELMLDRTESAAEECRRLVVDRRAYADHQLQYLDAELMASIALVAAKHGMPESAAQLLAYSEQEWKRLGYTRKVRNTLIVEKAHRLLEPALTEDELRRTRDAGERMTAAEARQLAASVFATEAPVEIE